MKTYEECQKIIEDIELELEKCQERLLNCKERHRLRNENDTTTSVEDVHD